MTAHSGEPQVTPSRRPERSSGASASFRAVESGLFPGLRRSRKACSSARSMRSPAGRPSTVTPIAAPWDCPNTPTRSVLPNSEDICLTSQPFVFLPEGGIKEQTTQVFSNIKAVLEEAGYAFDNIVKTTVFLADMSLFADMNAVYATQFSGAFPARSAVAVKELPKRALVEIEVIAIK